MKRLTRVLKILGLVLAAGLVLVTAWTWWAYPKRVVDSVFARPAPGAFTFAQIPRGRALTPEQIDEHAHRLLDGMSLEQRVLQMSGDTWVWDLAGQRLVGHEWTAGADRRLGLPPVVVTDGPRGIAMGSSTCFPVPMARAASWDRTIERRIGEAIGIEARAQGANVWLGPCVNLLRHPSWGRAQESYGEDPYLLGEMGTASVEGVQRHNVMACVKHYAANSIEETRHVVDVRVDERTLREVYLPHFERVVRAGAASVMTAYNKVNGDYAAESAHLVRDILKGEWGFTGFVMSDWFDGVFDGVKAARAGLDLEMPMVRVFGPALVAAVREGRVPPALIDDAVLRFLRRRIEYATRPDPMAYPPALVNATDHVALAREAAEQGIVLLRNEAGALPLDPATVRTLAVVGPLADVESIGDRGSSRVRPPEVITALEGLRAALGPGTRLVHEPGTDLAKARAAARGADAVVAVVGLTYQDEGEHIPLPIIDESEWGGDREDLALPAAQRALIEAVAAENPRTIVVLIGGATITVEGWHDRVPAILMAFYPGEQGGAAMARVLLGAVNPSGRLPFTVPSDASHLPPFDNVTEAVDYGPYHGYTLAEKSGHAPRYAFGFGLGYTTFSFANLSLDAPTVSPDGVVRAAVDVTNTGGREGATVVQLYVGTPTSRVERPVKLLRGFEKLRLAPGETRRVAIAVNAADLGYYDAAAKQWVVERTQYLVHVGGSSRPADLLTAEFAVVD